MSARTCLTLATVFGFLAVLLGAFGAHGLSDSGFLERKYPPEETRDIAGLTVPASYKYLQDFQTGVRYHMWHSLALMGVGLLSLQQRSRWLSAAAWSFVGGIILFSGSLYALVIAGPKSGGVTWGLVAPIGGTLLLIGWALLAIAIAIAIARKLKTEN